MVDHVGPHANHINVHIPEEQNIVRQIVGGLAGKTNHHPGTHLIADIPENFQAMLPDAPLMVPVLGMQGGVQPGIAGFNPQQVPVGAGLKPALIRFRGLLPYAQGQPQFSVGQVLDGMNQVFHLFGKFLILPLSGLESQRAVPVVVSPFGHGQDILPAGGEPLHLGVVPADAAVQAIFDALVGKLQKPPIIGHPAHFFGFHCIGRIVQGLALLGFQGANQGTKVCPVQAGFLQNLCNGHTFPFV